MGGLGEKAAPQVTGGEAFISASPWTCRNGARLVVNQDNCSDWDCNGNHKTQEGLDLMERRREAVTKPL